MSFLFFPMEMRCHANEKTFIQNLTRIFLNDLLLKNVFYCEPKSIWSFFASVVLSSFQGSLCVSKELFTLVTIVSD